MSCASVGSATRTRLKSGGGLPRHRLDSVQVALRSMLRLVLSDSCLSSGSSAPARMTRSRHGGESPAMFPSAHTACSRTSWFGDVSSSTKMGTAPLLMTTSVWSVVPEAMFVSAQAASNCRCEWSLRRRNSTNLGTTPALITSWMGGWRSMLKSRRKFMVIWCCTAGSFDFRPSTISGILAIFIASAASMVAPPSAPGAAPGAAATAPIIGCAAGAIRPAASVVRRRWFRRSSRLFLRIWMDVSSRRRRASSWSTPFLKLLRRAA
mmetsp:Transcript_10966/g.33395  ORF Transcript_10966/g.33395 Transcript_10966/m.33395 type:complete len:265 (+) Transcript_10966:1114-1908(+)